MGENDKIVIRKSVTPTRSEPATVRPEHKSNTVTATHTRRMLNRFNRSITPVSIKVSMFLTVSPETKKVFRR